MSLAFLKEFWLQNQLCSDVNILIGATLSEQRCDKDGMVANSRRKGKVHIVFSDLLVFQKPHPILRSFIPSDLPTIICCRIGGLMSFTLHFLAKIFRRKLEQKLTPAFAFLNTFSLISNSKTVQFRWSLNQIQLTQRF